MTLALTSDAIAVAAALLAFIAAVALAFAATRLVAALAFAVTAAFAGLTAIAAGAFDAGLALITAGALAALMTLASTAPVGDMDAVTPRPALAPLVACAMCGGALMLAWPNAPPAPALVHATRIVAFDAPRGMDMFIALAAFAAVAAGVVGLVGFGARGLFGPDKDGAA